MSDLAQALLSAVPEEGGSIGNQALYERLKGQIAGLSEAQFRQCRDTLISEGVAAFSISTLAATRPITLHAALLSN